MTDCRYDNHACYRSDKAQEQNFQILYYSLPELDISPDSSQITNS